MSSLSCHILDTNTGQPAPGIPVTLYHLEQSTPIASGITNSDGRFIFTGTVLSSASYTLCFLTQEYCRAQFGQSFYPKVEIHFQLDDSCDHYHIPLLLSPYAYSTYRGS